MMKKCFTTALLLALIFIAHGCATGPEPIPDGMQIYRSGWPAFSFVYPEQWSVKLEPVPGQVFRVEAPGQLPSAAATVNANMPSPVKFFSRSIIPSMSAYGRDFEVVSDRAITLPDDTPAQETVLNWVHQSGLPLTTLFVTVRKENAWISLSVSSHQGKITDELETIAHSLRVDQGEQPPVALPDDVTGFLDELSAAIVAHDLEKVMSYYSDQFMHLGRNKADVRKFYESVIPRIPDCKFVLTKFDRQQNLAAVAGYVEVMGSKFPIAAMVFRQRDEGGWEYYGNQQR